MYDEDLVEDSLAFAREIKAFLDKKASASQTSETAQPDSSAMPFYEPVTETEQAVRSHLAQQSTGSPNARPGQQASSDAITHPSPLSAQGQPVSSSQPVSLLQPVSSSQPVSSPLQPASYPPSQPAQRRPVSPAQPVSRPVTQYTPGQPVSSAQQSSPLAAQFTQEQSVPPASRPVEKPVQGQPMPTAQSVFRPVTQSAQGQPMPTTQSVSHPAAQHAQGQTAASPVTQTSMETLTERQSVTLANKTQNQMAQSSRSAPGQGDQPSSKLESSQSYQPEGPVQNQVSQQTTASSEIAAGAEVMDDGLEKKKNHTYEITIKFDLENIKKKFGRLKEKLAPETRTLEEINAAMEENQQLMEAGAHEGEGVSTGDGLSIAGKAGGIAGKLPKLLKKKETAGQLTEDGNAMDAEIVSLEDGEGGMFGTRLEEAKESISRKASSASRVVTNVIIFVFCIGIAYFFAKFVTTYVAHQTTVEGESMEPTLSDGDNVIIQMVTYYFKDPQRYDVVVFPITNSDLVNQRTYYIKRVIGLPGETVQIIDGCVYINGTQLKDDKYALSDILEPGVASDPLELGEDQYFVMGDNRNMSTDSRNSYVGLVNRDDIVGEAAVCIWPFSHFGSLKK